MSGIAASLPAAYDGEFGAAQTERLLWRAGFGPRRDQAKELAAFGLDRAVRSLTRPASTKLVGPAPHDEKGNPLAPYDAWGHDHLWWLDRMVRSEAPLVERMTLVWHDWFATSNDGVGNQRLMIAQNKALRSASSSRAPWPTRGDAEGGPLPALVLARRPPRPRDDGHLGRPQVIRSTARPQRCR